MKYFLAIDIGASSGRCIVGYKEDRLYLDEVYRFENGVSLENEHLVWNIDQLLLNVKTGIKKCLEKYSHIESMSIDTWGVDYVLLDGDEAIMPVYAYRDYRTKEIINEVHDKISFDRLYEITGSQFQEFNTIYQLYSDKVSNRLDKATDFLYIPEFLMYKLTNVKVHEYTNASTSGMLDSKTNDYSHEIIDSLGFDHNLFKKLSKPKTIVGDFTSDVQKEVGGNIKVVLCATHDTASAVEGIPMEENSLYISSGTWSLLGIKIDNPITNKEAQLANFSNEYGPNYIRFQKNIMGLWIIQNLSKELKMTFSDMVLLARSSSYHETFDVNDNRFLSCLNMKSEIIKYYVDNDKEIPENDADIINATYHSLAYSYKEAIDELEKIVDKKYKSLYIVGGGAKNQYLNELTQKYTKKEVIALPIEATAIGNLLIQM
ncbi:MAG: rhamnulokinase family protein [Bacilli bacterium]